MSQTGNVSLMQHYLTDVWNEHGDPRTGVYPMMGSFKYPLVIVSSFLLFVLYLGPRWMANRKAYSLKHILIPYNLILSLGK